MINEYPVNTVIRDKGAYSYKGLVIGVSQNTQLECLDFNNYDCCRADEVQPPVNPLFCNTHVDRLDY